MGGDKKEKKQRGEMYRKKTEENEGRKVRDTWRGN